MSDGSGREVTPSGVGPDGETFLATDSAQGPLTIYRLRAVDEQTRERRERHFNVLAAWRIEQALTLKKVDLAHGIVMLERTPQTLGERLADIEEPVLLTILGDVAHALAELHRAGLCHGSLNPWVIGVTAEGRGRLDTTGLRCRTRADALTMLCDDGGEGQRAAADLYALGAILFAGLRGVDALKAFLAAARSAATSDEHRSGAGALAVAGEMLDAEPAWRPTAGDVARRLAALRGAPPPLVRTMTESPTHSDVIGTPRTDQPAWPASIGRFQIDGLLGEGAMGRVYRGRDPQTGRDVAVKVLSGQTNPTPRALRRFKKEARLLGEVKNPGVAGLIDSGEDDGCLWMAVELVHGETLSEHLSRRGPLSEREALSIIADLSRALIDVHDRGIVHRDVKPDNVIIVAGDGAQAVGNRVKLIDFGIARHLDETESLAMTRQGAVMGTPLYMSPEQARGAAVDMRSDVYALGTVLFELMTGAAPFAGNGASMVLALQQERIPPKVSEVRPDASDEVARLVARALDKDPAGRFQDARELLAACLALLHEEPTTIAAHPRSPASEGVSRYVFEWDLKSPPRQLWPYVSNTDRLNRAIGLGAVDEHVKLEDGDPLRFGHTRQAGFDLRWREHPYEWVLERRIGVLREYSEGPLRSMRSTVDLKAAEGGGTHLVHTIEIDPRGVLGRAAAAVEIGVKTRRALDRVYRRIDELVHAKPSEPIVDAFEAAEPMGSAREERLAQLEKKIVDAGADVAVVARLGDVLRQAPAPDVARIRPIALARSMGVDEEAMVRACLIGAREGMLVPLWDLLCPSCRAPAGIEETLRAVRDHSHCEVCNLDFTLDLASSIELVFRVHPQLRPSDAATYCLSSPGKTPHVVAQVRVQPGESFLLETALPEGNYQLVGRRLGYVVSFRVANEGGSRWQMSLARGPTADLGRTLRAGRQEMVLINDTDREQLVRVERTAPRDDVFTAARAAAHPLFRQLFPNEVLEPGALVRVASIVLLHAEVQGAVTDDAIGGDPRSFGVLYGAYKAIEAAVGEHGGSVVKIMGDGVLAVFDEPADAVRVALTLDDAVHKVAPAARVRVAVHRGPAAAVTLNDRLDYFGRSVQDVVLLARKMPSQGVVVSDDVISDPVVQELLDDRARRRILPSRLMRDTASQTDPLAVA